MKLLIEEYQYNVADVEDILEGLFTLQDVEQRISVSYVGYFYNPKVKDVVFILPKVLIDEHGLVFGHYRPEDVIDLDKAQIEDRELKFIYEFAVWIHRAIVVYNDTHADNQIVLHRQIESVGRGGKKKRNNTLLDIILSLIRFNRENQQFFTFILKNLHSGLNKINWQKTLSKTPAIVQADAAVYLDPVNKKRQVNFDEELLVIFYSILQNVSDEFGFRVHIPFGFKLIKGNQFKRYKDGYGRTRLRQIKNKYFSDLAVRLWDLCYAYFDKTYLVKVNATQSEYLLVKSFHIVFEAMIDELIGTPQDQIPKGLKEQDDGKLVDHFYTYESLLIDNKPDDDIYYIGDSKYYKMGHDLGRESTYKQRTYARNVIQWNLDIHNERRENPGPPFGNIELYDSVTEGYNVIPNFFISADIDNDTLTYAPKLKARPFNEKDLSYQFRNRLYDRDTLLLSHYDVNFLHVLSLYARDNAGAKRSWRAEVRAEFRSAIQEVLKTRFEFYALAPHPDVDDHEYFETHMRDTLGKIFRPFEKRELYSLALDKLCPEENERLKNQLAQNFYLVPCELGTDPSGDIAVETARVGTVESPAGKGKFLFGVVTKYDQQSAGVKIVTTEYMDFTNHTAKEYVMRNMPGGDVSKVSYFVPLFDGGFSGYYDIEGYSFGTRKTDVKDASGNTVRVDMPVFKVRLGAYHSLGDEVAPIPNFRYWNGQIHSYGEVTRLYNQTV